jgi:LacI family transcriptional regulator
MQATLEAGKRIPGDIAFVGCGNVRYSDHLRIPLSSMDQSTGLLGSHAGWLALDLMSSRLHEPKNIRVAPALVVRASSVATQSA